MTNQSFDYRGQHIRTTDQRVIVLHYECSEIYQDSGSLHEPYLLCILNSVGAVGCIKFVKWEHGPGVRKYMNNSAQSASL